MATISDFTLDFTGLDDADLPSLGDFLDADMVSSDELLNCGRDDGPEADFTSWRDFLDADMGSSDELLKCVADRPIVVEMTMPRDFAIASNEGLSSLLDFRSGDEAEDKARLSMNPPQASSHLGQDATKREGMEPIKQIGEFEAWTTLQSNLKEEVIGEIEKLISESGRDKVCKLTNTAEDIRKRVSSLPIHSPEKRANALQLPVLKDSLRVLFESLQTLLSSAHGGQDLLTVLGAMSQLIKDGQSLVDKLGNVIASISAKVGQLVKGLKSREDDMDKLFLKCSSNIPALVESFLEQESVNFVSVAPRPQERPQERQAQDLQQANGTINDSLRRNSCVKPSELTMAASGGSEVLQFRNSGRNDDRPHNAVWIPVSGGPSIDAWNTTSRCFPDCSMTGEDWDTPRRPYFNPDNDPEDSPRGTEPQQIPQKEPEERQLGDKKAATDVDWMSSSLQKPFLQSWDLSRDRPVADGREFQKILHVSETLDDDDLAMYNRLATRKESCRSFTIASGTISLGFIFSLKITSKFIFSSMITKMRSSCGLGCGAKPKRPLEPRAVTSSVPEGTEPRSV